MTVEQIMTTEVICVEPQTSVKEVARTLYKSHLTGVPVVGPEQKLLGIITEGDIVRRDSHIHLPQVIQILDSFIYPAGVEEMERELAKITAVEAQQLMTKEVVSVTKDTTVEDLATLMVDRDINPVPVIDEAERVIGIVSKSDLVWLLARDNNQPKK